jgi:hypothetical protein
MNGTTPGRTGLDGGVAGKGPECGACVTRCPCGVEAVGRTGQAAGPFESWNSPRPGLAASPVARIVSNRSA